MAGVGRAARRARDDRIGDRLRVRSYKAALAAGGTPSAVFALALALATAINLTRTRGVAGYARGRTGRILVMGIVRGGSVLILLEGLAAGGALAFAIGERPGRTQITGAMLVAAGAVLMAWP
ncbi:MAG TPA: hypothetical protein VGF94_19775 [Kofleriaceae bacterium]